MKKSRIISVLSDYNDEYHAFIQKYAKLSQIYPQILLLSVTSCCYKSRLLIKITRPYQSR